MREKYFTTGPILKQVVLFALPLLGSAFIQQFYNTIDLLFVGQTIGKTGSAAVGASTMIVTCLVGLFSGISVGASVVASKHFGANDREKTALVIQTAAALTVVSSIVLTVLGIVGAKQFLILLGTPKGILQAGGDYLRIYFLSAFFMIAYNMGTGILRAMGNSKTPLYYQLAGGLVNIVMDAVFVFGLHMGVKGVAFATLFSQGAAAILTIQFLFCHLEKDIRLRYHSIHIDREQLHSILRVGIPAGIQALVITFSNLIVQYFINSLGTETIAAFTVYLKVELPIYYPIMAIGQAATIFVAQNHGAGNRKRCNNGVLICLGISLILTVGISSTLLWLGNPAFGIFGVGSEVTAVGLQMIRITFPFYFLYCFLQIFGDALKGIGKSHLSMVIVLLCVCGIRSMLLLVLVPGYPSIETVAIVYPITWGTTGLLMLLSYVIYIKDRKLHTIEKEAENEVGSI